MDSEGGLPVDAGHDEVWPDDRIGSFPL